MSLLDIHFVVKLLLLLQYYNHFMAPWTLSRTTWVSRYQKGKTNLDSQEQEIVSGSGISWDICKSAPRSRQITMPTFHQLMPFLPPNQQHQSTVSKITGIGQLLLKLSLVVGCYTFFQTQCMCSVVCTVHVCLSSCL